MKTITVRLMSAATLGIGLLYGPAASAAFFLRIDEVGADVVATGSGSIDVADLSSDESGSITPSRTRRSDSFYREEWCLCWLWRRDRTW